MPFPYPLTFIMPGTPSDEELELIKWAKSSVPKSLHGEMADVGTEVWAAVAKALVGVQRRMEDSAASTYIKFAEGVWLNAHAKDRGTSRQGGESDPALRERLRNFEDAVTPAAVINSIEAVLEAAGFSSPGVIVELREGKAFVRTVGVTSGTNVTFSLANGLTYLQRSTGSFTGYELGREVQVTGASVGGSGNNGVFTIEDVDGADKIGYVNGTGIAGVDASAAWVLDPKQSGKHRAFSSRGYRMGSLPPSMTLVVILPYGTSTGTVAAIREALRLRKAAGIKVLVEVRVTAPATPIIAFGLNQLVFSTIQVSRTRRVRRLPQGE